MNDDSVDRKPSSLTLDELLPRLRCPVSGGDSALLEVRWKQMTDLIDTRCEQMALPTFSVRRSG